MEQEKEKNEETFVKKVVQTALEAERQIRRQQVLHNTRMLMEEYIEMKRHIESAVSEEEELKEEQYDVFRGEGAHLGSVRRSKMKTAMMIANIDRAMEELPGEYETKEMYTNTMPLRCIILTGYRMKRLQTSRTAERTHRPDGQKN